MTILPIPSSRVSDLTATDRLISQLQADQTNMANLEAQISSGNALTYPSDNPGAAQRGLQLKQLIAQNTQYQTNLTSSQASMSQTDSALGNVGNIINNITSVAQGVNSTTSSQQQLDAAASQVGQAITQLVSIGNQQYNGQYLFGGSETSSAPFTVTNGFVQYNGNEGTTSTYAAINQLLVTNVDGNTAFGGLSPTVLGTANLTPALTANTPLSTLNGGQGVAQGSIAVSDGKNTSVVNLKNASTLGDVAQLIEANPPAGRQVTVAITATGLQISLDSAGGGALNIQEVGGGTTAENLGIRQDIGTSTQITGGNLSPQLTPTTPLSDLLGTQASAQVISSGPNNDLIITANEPGVATNGVTVSFVNNPSIVEGQETVAYDSTNNTLTFQIAAGSTTANDIVRTLNNDPVAGAVFQASLKPEDTDSPTASGQGLISTSATATLAGGAGQALDTSGLTINSGGKTYAVSFAGDRTVQDLLNSIDAAGAGTQATINAQGNGINIQSTLSGADFSVGENGGTTAAQLGVRTLTAGTPLADLNYGQGVTPVGAGTPDFVIQRPDGTQLAVSVSGAKTIGDVLNLINNDPNNQGANQITASLATTGNGIQLSTAATGSSPFEVIEQNSSIAAQQLGLVPTGSSSSAAGVVAGTTTTLTGADSNPQEVSGVFNTLIRLQKALTSDNQPEIQRTIGMLAADSSRATLAQGAIGVREQALQSSLTSLQNQSTTLQSQMSQNLDVDMTSAISQFTAEQTAFEASLEVTAAISKLTLLNYL